MPCAYAVLVCVKVEKADRGADRRGETETQRYPEINIIERASEKRRQRGGRGKRRERKRVGERERERERE